MSDEISVTLTWFANYANFYSIVSVLLCFFVMVVFILRLNGENFLSSSATHYPVVKEQQMVSLLNPFSVQLDTSKCSSLKDGLYLSLSMKKQSKVKLLWGVDIRQFQTELQLPSTQIADRFKNNRSFEESFRHSVDCGMMNEEDSERLLYFKPPSDLSEELLGEPPRMLYPVVVVCQLEDCDIQQGSTAVVVQFTVIHLKDSICSLDSHIVYQFVKTNTNKLLGLQPIFMTTSEPDRQRDYACISVNGKNSLAANSYNQDQVNCNMTDKGNGQLLSESDKLMHCDCCGKIKRHVENIPSTRQHEVCNCSESDLEKYESERSGAKVVGQDKGHGAEGVQNNSGRNERGKECSNTGSINTDNDEDLEPELHKLDSCCVCQSSEIFYTLLPCRHACVCSTCIRHLDKCPICRSHIEAYFRLHNRLSEQDLRENMEQASAGPRLNRWEALNQRLNEMFGLV